MDWAVIAALVVAGSALVGSLVAARTARRDERRSVRTDDFAKLKTLVNEIQEERNVLIDERTILHNRIERLELAIKEMAAENRQLHDEVRELKDHRKRQANPAAVALMQQVPEMVSELVECEDPAAAQARLRILLRTVDTIQSLVDGDEDGTT